MANKYLEKLASLAGVVSKGIEGLGKLDTKAHGMLKNVLPKATHGALDSMQRFSANNRSKVLSKLAPKP